MRGVTKNCENVTALHRFLCGTLCVPVISDIEDYLLSGIYFRQIDSHTGTEGARLRTRQVIEDLILFFNRKT